MIESLGTILAERPYVILNVAESADGKLAPIDGGKINFGSGEDRAGWRRFASRPTAF